MKFPDCYGNEISFWHWHVMSHTHTIACPFPFKLINYIIKPTICRQSINFRCNLQTFITVSASNHYQFFTRMVLWLHFRASLTNELTDYTHRICTRTRNPRFDNISKCFHYSEKGVYCYTSYILVTSRHYITYIYIYILKMHQSASTWSTHTVVQPLFMETHISDQRIKSIYYNYCRSF